MIVHIPFFHSGWVQFVVALPALVIGLQYFGKSAIHSLQDKNPNMDVLVSMGALAAVAYSFALMAGGHEGHLYFETAVTIITLVLLGNNIEARALSKTSIQMQDTASLLPAMANRVEKNQETGEILISSITSDRIKTGDLLIVNEGEKVPADGIVTEGAVEVSEAVITGESAPVFKKKGDNVLAGSVLVSGNFTLQVSKTGQDTLAGQMRNWIKGAQASKPHIQKIGDKVSGIFVQVVVSIAVAAFLLNYFVADVGFEESILRAIAVLVISCPCAMGLATPTAVSVGLGMAARKGILVKGGQALEKFAAVKVLALDKTGTITTGDFLVDNFAVLRGDEPHIKNIIWQIEQRSSHPIAKSIVKNHANWFAQTVEWEEIIEKKGYGMTAMDKLGNHYKLGSARFGEGGELPQADLFLWENNQLTAYFTIKDEPVSNLKNILQYFKEEGLKLFLLSGDSRAKVDAIVKDLPFDETFAEVLPDEKMSKLETWRKTGKTAMTGDGINDAPALAAADVAVVVGHGSDLSKQQADFILLDKGLQKLMEAHKVSKIALGGIKQNLFWAFAYNVVAIPIAAMGGLNPTWAALFMAMSDVVVIGNALRLRWVNLNK
ncbi:MAG: cation-translocating P-type ATPase [Bacteroidia bacterium]|nr:cation-translocating P-type ATPase [Bacteroidia bacterium]MCO5253425.1 cation-translocating P-type ATPase [Bacteroidota bacterium]MCZ2129881.1 cation-translocating P-type ATPase [Bacteroidia bacterium]